MSKHRIELTLNHSLPESLAACERAASPPHWRVTRRTGNTIECLETGVGASGFTNPATVVVSFEATGGSTRAVLNASNFGFGPIQSGHVKKQANSLAQRIVAEAGRTPDAVAAASQSGHAVFFNGKPLSDAELQEIERKYRFAVPDGRYWYDPVCGAWGFEGGPQCGVAVAGLAYGGPLRADASGGNTGVFVNGRELHAIDISLLASLVGAVIPGRWSVDAGGNFGPDGWPKIGNIYALVQSRMSAASGGSSGDTGKYGSLVSNGSFIGFQGAPGSGVSASSGW